MPTPEIRPLDVDRASDILSRNLPWSPLDFVPGISVEGDKAIYVKQLMDNVESQDDLRFIGETEEGDIAVFARRLPWDSSFFGYGVARVDGVFPLSEPYPRPHADYAPLLLELVSRARAKEIRYLFAHVNPKDLAMLRGLGDLGFAVIETRVLYHISLVNYKHDERYPVRPATADDIATLGRVATEAVNPYDRFHADPYIKKEDMDRLMYKWVEASIMESFADITLVPAVSTPGAFCTVKYHKDNWNAWGLRIGQPVLSAVAREFKGWYQKLISEANYHLQEIGAEHSYLSTQTTNKAALWIWEKLGYRFGRGELVLRLVL
jgi:dTDP-4-amino-4,6-dideoxy-D-galactose acyltransferase